MLLELGVDALESVQRVDPLDRGDQGVGGEPLADGNAEGFKDIGIADPGSIAQRYLCNGLAACAAQRLEFVAFLLLILPVSLGIDAEGVEFR